MTQQIFNEQDLPIEDLEKIGLAKNGKLILNEGDRKALLSGRRTDMLRLENLSADGLHIPLLDAKLSLKLSEIGILELLVHPIYRKAEHPPYLTEAAAQELVKGKVVNIQKMIFDDQGRQKEILVEFDRDTREFIITDSERILVPDMVNNEYLSLGQKERYRKGKEVTLADGTTFQYSGTETKGIRSNKLALVASILIDGGLSYVLYKGLNAIFGQKQDQENSKGYEKDLENLQQQDQAQNHKPGGEYSRGYSRTNAR